MVYIVYAGDFSTDKPREYMAKPDIMLVTTNKDEAVKRLDSLYSEFQENGYYGYKGFTYSKHEDYIGFNDGWNSYGCAGVIEAEVET